MTRWITGVVVCLLLFAGSASAENIVVNPGFENNPADGWYVAVADPTDWTFIDIGGTVLSAHSGSNDMVFGAVDVLAGIAQDIPTTRNASYTFSWWMKNQGAPNEFQVSWNGTVLSDLTNIADTDWTQFVFPVVAPSNSDTTTIKFLGLNQEYYVFLDDVSVTPITVPEPTAAVLLISALSGGLGLIAVRRWRRWRAA